MYEVLEVEKFLRYLRIEVDYVGIIADSTWPHSLILGCNEKFETNHQVTEAIISTILLFLLRSEVDLFMLLYL